MEKVSVIVPIYNVENYVEKCLTSLINQTYKNIVVYAISDGSPDNSIEIVKKYAKDDNRIIAIEKENGGYGSVLEYAISLIDTKYFLICDPDDWLETNAIEVMINCLEKHKSDFVFGNYFKIYSDNKCIKESVVNNNYPINDNELLDNISNLAYTKVSPHSKMFLTKYAKNIRFPYKVSYTDTLLFLVYLSKIKNAVYINDYLSYYYFDRPGNTMNKMKNYNKKTFDQVICVLDNTLSQLDVDSDIYDDILTVIYYNYLSIRKKIRTINDKQEQLLCKKVLDCRFKDMKKYKNNIEKKIYDKNVLKKLIKKIRFFLLIN